MTEQENDIFCGCRIPPGGQADPTATAFSARSGDLAGTVKRFFSPARLFLIHSKKHLKNYSAGVKLPKHFFDMVQVIKELCLKCGGCVALCQPDALELTSDGLLIKKELCTCCYRCVNFCPLGALSQDER